MHVCWSSFYKHENALPTYFIPLHVDGKNKSQRMMKMTRIGILAIAVELSFVIPCFYLIHCFYCFCFIVSIKTNLFLFNHLYIFLFKFFGLRVRMSPRFSKLMTSYRQYGTRQKYSAPWSPSLVFLQCLLNKCKYQRQTFSTLSRINITRYVEI